MICKNCGAHFDDHLPECPYCGQFSYAGAEKEYMDRLEDMREDLEELHETVPEMYTGELKKQAKHVRKILLIVLGILTALALLFFGGSKLVDSLYQYDAKAELLFTKEAFPIADEYYDAGDYDGLLEFYQTSLEENSNASFYSWEHYPFLICYENYTIFQYAVSLMGTEDFSEYYMTELFYCYAANRYHQKGYPMNETDQRLVASYEDEMETVIDNLGLTEEEQKEFHDLLNKSDYYIWDDVETLSKKVYKRMY